MALAALIVALLLEQVQPLARDNPVHRGVRAASAWVARNTNAGEARHGALGWLLLVLVVVLVDVLLAASPRSLLLHREPLGAVRQGEPTEAVVVRLPSAVGRTVIWTVAESPKARSPSWAVSVPLAWPVVPCDGVTDWTVAPAGRRSVRTTLVARVGPLLRTVTT